MGRVGKATVLLLSFNVKPNVIIFPINSLDRSILHCGIWHVMTLYTLIFPWRFSLWYRVQLRQKICLWFRQHRLWTLDSWLISSLTFVDGVCARSVPDTKKVFCRELGQSQNLKIIFCWVNIFFVWSCCLIVIFLWSVLKHLHTTARYLLSTQSHTTWTSQGWKLYLVRPVAILTHCPVLQLYIPPVSTQHQNRLS